MRKARKQSSSDVGPSSGPDHMDFINLLVGLMKQSIDDYVRLQHPKARDRKYLEEYFLSAFDFLFDDEYRLMNINNGYGDEMSLADLISEVLDTERPDVQALRLYARRKCAEYWEEKKMPVFDHIPATVCVSGQTFNIEHAVLRGYALDWDNYTIQIDKSADTAQQSLMDAMVHIMVELKEIRGLGPKNLKLLSKELMTLLKVNNCFAYVGSTSAEDPELLIDRE